VVPGYYARSVGAASAHRATHAAQNLLATQNPRVPLIQGLLPGAVRQRRTWGTIRAMLAQSVLRLVHDPLRARLAEWPTLDQSLAQLVDRARLRWPEIDLDASLFLSYLAERLPAEWEAAQVFDSAHVGDVFLACGCASGLVSALAAFEGHYMSEVDRAAERLRLPKSAASDLAATVREQLLVAHAGREPTIARYSGIGSLRSWLRVTITRMALRTIERERRQAIPDADIIAAAPSPGTLPDLQYLKRLYRSEFAVAFREATASLTPRQRTLLRQRYLDGLTGDELAGLYRVHRATVVRWLGGARKQLLARTRTILVQRLRVGAAEADSILRMIRSQLDVSIPFFLPGDDTDDDP